MEAKAFITCKRKGKVFEIMETIHITTDHITLGQLLKRCGVIGTGGAAKWYLEEHVVFVNGEQENRRGKKLYDKDTVELPDFGSFLVSR